MPNQHSLIEIRDNELAALRQELADIRGEIVEPLVDDLIDDSLVDDTLVDDTQTDDALLDDLIGDDAAVEVTGFDLAA